MLKEINREQTHIPTISKGSQAIVRKINRKKSWDMTTSVMYKDFD